MTAAAANQRKAEHSATKNEGPLDRRERETQDNTKEGKASSRSRGESSSNQKGGEAINNEHSTD